MPESTMAMPMPVPSSARLGVAARAASVPVVSVTWPVALTCASSEMYAISVRLERAFTAAAGKSTARMFNFEYWRLIVPPLFLMILSSVELHELAARMMTETFEPDGKLFTCLLRSAETLTLVEPDVAALALSPTIIPADMERISERFISHATIRECLGVFINNCFLSKFFNSA